MNSERIIQFWPQTTSKNIASFRIRCQFICSALKAQQLNVSYNSRLDKKAEVIILSKRYDAKSVDQALRLKHKYGAKILLDICDNHFIYDKKSINGKQKSEQLRHAVKNVDGVVASTEYLRNIIMQECNQYPPISVIGDFTDSPRNSGLLEAVISPRTYLQLHMCKKWLLQQRNLICHRLVWFGNHAGSYHEAGMTDLLLRKDLLESLAAKYPLSLTVISNSFETYKHVTNLCNFPTFYLPWNLLTFSEAIKLHGVSIIPISKNQFTLAKTANRVTTSLIHGLQVVADEIPSYSEFNKYIYLNNWSHGLTECLNNNGKALNSFSQRFYNKNIISQWQKLFECI